MQTISLTPGYNSPHIPIDKLIGLKAVYKSYDGSRLIGTLTDIGETFPVIKFNSGQIKQTNGHYELIFPLRYDIKE